MTETDDKLLQDFFTDQKKEIADKGFSRRVAQNLPGRSNRLSQLWTIFVTLAGIVLFFALGGLDALWSTLREVFISMVQSGTATLDPKSLIIAAVVLIFLGTRKVCSLA